MTEEQDNTTRQSRESENHANNTRRKPWTPVRKLETPEPPEGYEYRWIRESMLGQEDRSNVSKRLREGWELVRGLLIEITWLVIMIGVCRFVWWRGTKRYSGFGG